MLVTAHDRTLVAIKPPSRVMRMLALVARILAYALP
jgi:hypothetical protein